MGGGADVTQFKNTLTRTSLGFKPNPSACMLQAVFLNSMISVA
jgi:hypothetical protein